MSQNTIRQDVWKAANDELRKHGMGEQVASGLANKIVDQFSANRRKASSTYSVPADKEAKVREMLLGRAHPIHAIAKNVKVGVSTVQRIKAELEMQGKAVGYDRVYTSTAEGAQAV